MSDVEKGAADMTTTPPGVVYLLMVDSGDSEGMPSRGGSRPVAAYTTQEQAEHHADIIRTRPDGATFWIPPAEVKVMELPLYTDALAAITPMLIESSVQKAIDHVLGALFQQDPRTGHVRLRGGATEVSEGVIRKLVREAIDDA